MRKAWGSLKSYFLGNHLPRLVNGLGHLTANWTEVNEGHILSQA